MASHLHRTHLPTACCCGGGGGGGGGFTTPSPCFQTHHNPSPLPLSPSPSDPLLQAIASQILQSAQLQHSSQYPNLQSHRFQSHYQFQPLNSHNQKRVRQQELPQVIHHSNLASLLSRIEALESSLHLLSAFNAPPQSLRHVAARTIQTHFRAFLVRRSRTLGQLKDLAFIKSSFDCLKSSLFREVHFDYNAISLEIVNLFHDLDSIQSSDPLVKDSKKSISRDLVQFLEQIDSFAVKRYEPPVKAMENLRLRQNVNKSRVSHRELGSFGNEKEAIEKLKSRVEKICERSRSYENDGKDLNLRRSSLDSDEDDDGESPRITIKDNNQTHNRIPAKGHKISPIVKKSVRFAENGNLFRVLGSNSPHGDDGALVDERDSSDELGNNTCNEAEEIKEFSEVAEDEEEEAHGDGGSPEISDGERNPRRKMTSGGRRSYDIKMNNNGGSAFSAPLPLKMENKAELMKSRKSLKILG